MTKLVQRESQWISDEVKINYYECGSFGCVFFDDEGFAIKVFKNKSNVSRNHIEQVFKFETDAYELAMQDSDLKKIVPTYHGKLLCDSVHDSKGNDISNKFHLDLAYKMTKLSGRFEKKSIEDELVRKKFESAGINHISDVSIATDGMNITGVVDFATQEIEIMADDVPDYFTELIQDPLPKKY
ncbi:hypothetical protein [Comamonas sp. MYb69]|uniref:hypothetical protein n=1 Tax=Comamonas sp. MYb69 TaxID=1848650 RepID=UPI0030A85CDD